MNAEDAIMLLIRLENFAAFAARQACRDAANAEKPYEVGKRVAWAIRSFSADLVVHAQLGASVSPSARLMACASKLVEAFDDLAARKRGKLVDLAEAVEDLKEALDAGGEK